MKAVFADTFYFLALLNPTDNAHKSALSAPISDYGRVITSAWVLIEVADALSFPPNRSVFLNLLSKLKNNPQVVIVPPDRDFFEKGLERFSQRLDKEWSLTDCISFIIMEQNEITDVLTGDNHFGQAGFRVLLKD